LIDLIVDYNCMVQTELGYNKFCKIKSTSDIETHLANWYHFLWDEFPCWILL